MYNQPTRPEDRQERVGYRADYAVHLAVVVNNVDPTFAGRLDVWIPMYGGDPTNKSGWITVSYANPFYGISSYSATQRLTGTNTSGQFMANEQNPFTAGQMDDSARQGDVMTYGMWTQPPALGTRVLIAFADGDTRRGYWFAAIPEVAHAMIPAIGAGQSGQPESEFDPASPETQTQPDLRQLPRPPHPSAQVYAGQGLQEDKVRGPITTSSLRESPSTVMGFATPGGHTFAMDDGDEGGTSRLIRLRTAGGNQITMHDDTGMIYLINAGGTGWMELSPSGQIDVYGAAGINLASEGDINIHGNKNVSIHAGENLKLIGMKGTKIQGKEEMQIHGAKTMIEGVDSLHLHSCTEIRMTSFKDIFIKAFNFLVIQGKCFRWNSGTAKEAEQVPPETPQQVDGYDTTVARAPSKEPYKSHDGGQAGAAGAATSGGTQPGFGSGSPGGASLTGFGGSGLLSGIDTDTTSLGNNFSLGFNTGLAGNKTTPATSINSSASSGTRGLNSPSPFPAFETQGDIRALDSPERLANPTFVPTPSPGANKLAPKPTIDTSKGVTVTGGQGIAAFSSSNNSTVPASTAQTNAALGRGGAPPLGPDPALANVGSLANNALGQISGQSPLSSIPAAMGGGAAGFAQGDNCERPSDGGGPGGGEGGSANPTGAGDEGLSTAKGPEGQLSQKEMYDLMIAEGLSPEDARLMSAIGMAESRGKFGELNSTAPDLSYGLWQINMYDNLGPARRQEFGLSSNADLYNPATNARVAARIFKQQGPRPWGAYTNGSYAQFY